ncbi:MAG: glycosyltransferase family 4 protein [Firmicutes bacterium]|nr:glycosyltransferase family 4 protein [Bacillota bacterium]MDH7495728.1 glycosyltransferase family 4 protein [Bacillota bacterium]
MRVLMLSYEYPPEVVGGLGAAVAGLAQALVKQGDEVHVICASSRGDAESFAQDGVKISRVARSTIRAGADPYGAGGGFLQTVMEANFGLTSRAVLEARGRPGYDVLHAHDWLVGFAAKSLKHAMHIPLIATIHSTEYGRNRGIHSDLQKYIHEVEWMITYEAWRVICCSHYMADELRRIFSLPGDKIDVIPNGVDPNAAVRPDAELVRATRVRYAHPEDRIVFYVGRLVYEKGVHVLLDAVPSVLAEIPNTRFVIAGDGYYAGVLREKAANMGLGPAVVFTGRISDQERDALYAAADLVVFPSLYEPFGIVALEAMAKGAPVVASDTGGLAEVIQHEETGFKVCSGSAASLAWGIKRVLLDPAFRGFIARRGKEEAVSRFGWETAATSTHSVYQRVLDEAARVSW